MSEPDNLTLEHLRAIRAVLAGVDRKVDDIATEQRITNAHVAGLVQHESYAIKRFAELETRLDRIEKRLDLRED